MEIVKARTNSRIQDFLPEHLAFNQNVRQARKHFKQASQALLTSKQSIEKRRKVTEIRGEICASLPHVTCLHTSSTPTFVFSPLVKGSDDTVFE